jgi:hypothetical protein
MKTQMMSLVLLAAMITSANVASAQSDVPDNMLSSKNVPGDCTLAQLTDGSCQKDVYSNYSIVTNINIPAENAVTILTSGECGQQMEVMDPNQGRQRLNGGLTYSQAGQYQIINNNFQTCTVRIMINQ